MSTSSVTEVEIEPAIPSEIPADFQYFFKRPPLLNEEDPIEYWILVRQFIQHVSPKAIIEWIWLKDVADHTWEIWRLRRLRAALVREAPAWGDYAQMLTESKRCKRGTRRSENTAADRLSVIVEMNHYQVLDRLLASAELRRDRIFAQVEFHVAQRLREAAEMVEGNFHKPRLAAA